MLCDSATEPASRESCDSSNELDSVHSSVAASVILTSTPADYKLSNTLDDVPCIKRPLLCPIQKDHPCSSHVERQPEERSDQQEERKDAEVERPLGVDGSQKQHDGPCDRKRDAHVDQPRGHGDDHDAQDPHQPDG